MEMETAVMLAGTIIHSKGCTGGLKVNPALNLDDDGVFNLCKEASQCIRVAVQEEFVKLSVDLNTQLKNGMLGKKATVPKSPNKPSVTLKIPDDND